VPPSAATWSVGGRGPACPRMPAQSNRMKPEAPVWLPLLNTGLIGVSGLFLALGYSFIRRKQVVPHHRSMLIATLFAALFLVVYVARAVLFETKFFAGEGLVRVFYFLVLISHTILAIAVGPMVLVTLFRALRGDFGRHRRLARLTAPIWAYVVVTGWIIYLMLYRGP
jgi:putative membrane protein